MTVTAHIYAIALGSNRRSRLGGPERAVEAALRALTFLPVTVSKVSSIHHTPALGPARRRFANAAALIETTLPPHALLARLKAIERDFGRRPGQRWGDRVVDLDILLWAGGSLRSRTLTIPHAQIAHRRFVLDPLVEIAPDWRLPGSALRIRHLRARLTRRRAAA